MAALAGIACALQAAVERSEFLLGFRETDLESLDFADPAVRPRFCDALGEVADDLAEPRPL